MKSSPRRARAWRIVLVLFLATVFIVGTTISVRAIQARPYTEFKVAARQLELQLERWWVDDPRGNYPTDSTMFRQYAAEGRLPNNPYAGGQVIPFEPGCAGQPGAFVYLPLANGTVVQDKGEFESHWRWITPDSPPLGEHEEISHWVLVLYGPKAKPRLRQEASDYVADMVGMPPLARRDVAGFDPEPPGIDWKRVSYVLTSTRWDDKFV